MMKPFKYLTTIMAGLALATFGDATPSPAAEEQAATSQAVESVRREPTVVRTISGTVTAVVPDAKTLVVTVPKWETGALVVGAWVTDQTVIKKGKAEKRLEDLKVGDQVRMKFEQVSDGDIAHVIVVKPGRQRE